MMVIDSSAECQEEKAASMLLHFSISQTNHVRKVIENESEYGSSENREIG